MSLLLIGGKGMKVTFFSVKERASYESLPPSLELFMSNSNTNTIFTFKNLPS